MAIASESVPATGSAVEANAPAGGWHRLDVRVLDKGGTVAEASFVHVGVGEIFVVAGQSNSANHGEEKRITKTGRVAAFDGKAWQLANDPQLGASGTCGSFMPPLGDLLVERFHVPVGFILCGVGATSVREWLPEGVAFPDPPTFETRVRHLTDGRWESKGQAFATLVERTKYFGPGGFRAVLWHRGESDANQKDPARTLPGPSPEIRAAQAALWQAGLPHAGPDSDALKRGVAGAQRPERALQQPGPTGARHALDGKNRAVARFATPVRFTSALEILRVPEDTGTRTELGKMARLRHFTGK